MKNKKWMTIQMVKVRAKLIIALFAIISFSSCGDDDGDTANPPGDGNVRIIEVDAAADQVTLQNFGEGDVDISGYWFCIRRNYEQLNSVTIESGDLILSENETVTFSVSVNDEGSDVSIYNTGGSFASASALVDFMQFNGSYTTNGREDVAVEKGIWAAGAFVEGASVFIYNGNGTQNGVDQWSGDAVEAGNVRIIEVDAAADEVTLQNFGAGEVNISDYWFCLLRNYEQLSEVTIASGDLVLSENETVTFSITVNDAGSDVSIYNTGGAFASAAALVDFMQFNGSYTTNGREDVAVEKGIWAAGVFVEGATVFTYNGNGSQNGVDQWSGNAETAAASNVRILEVDPAGDLVTLKNFGTEAEDISGYFFCIRKTYPGLGSITPISGDLTLDPDEEIQFPVTINDASSDVSIYMNSNDFTVAGNMIDFMQFGADVGNDGRVSVAVEKGIWTAGEFVDGIAPYNFTGSLEDNGASFWSEAAAAIRIVSINPDTESVTLKNIGKVEKDISAYQFCLGPGNYNQVNNYTTVTGDFVLSVDEEVTIDLSSSNGNVSALAAQGGLGLFKDGSAFGSEDPEQLKDYVQWGAANQARVGQAVNATRWDSADNFVSGTAPFTFSGESDDVGSSFWQ